MLIVSHLIKVTELLYNWRFTASPSWRQGPWDPRPGHLIRVESYITTDVQLANLSWNKAPIWGLRPDFYYFQKIAGLLMWGALSDERTGLPYTISAGPRQRSHTWVRVPCDSRPYFTVSDSRLPFSSPLTTHRATVEVFDTASTRDSSNPSYRLSLHRLRTGHIILYCIVRVTQQKIVYQVSVFAETCLSSRCLAMRIHVTVCLLLESVIIL
jgi:hypothetical protein